MRLIFVAAIAGLAHAASIATPWSGEPSGWLQLLALATLVWLLQRCPKPAQAAWVTWAFTSAWLTGTFWWMFVAMNTYGGLPAWLAALAVFALAAALSLYYAAAGAAFAALRPSSPLGSAVLFAALWLLAELARGVWFTGFGWGAAGYAHIDGIGRFARYVGAYGITAAAAFLAALLAIWSAGPVLAWRRAWMPVAAAGIAAFMVWMPGARTDAGPTLRVALLQGNIPQDEKFQPGTGVVDALRWYGAQLNESQEPLVVAPETAIPLLPQDLPDGYWEHLRRRFSQGRQAVLLGIPLQREGAGYTNSVVGFKPGDGASPAGGGGVYRYDKHHLVPFGEFIPPLFRWFTEMMHIPLGDFDRGGVGQASFEWQGQRLAPNICYEDLFGEELGARFADAARAPTIFVNVSNIAWFGNTVAIDQHVNISRMRAIEFGRPFIRSTNTGDTAIIDHEGRITHRLARHQRGVLRGDVQGRNGITPFAWWVSRTGLWPMWLLGAGVAVAALVASRRRSPEGP